jgi:hypothetical protein
MKLLAGPIAGHIGTLLANGAQTTIALYRHGRTVHGEECAQGAPVYSVKNKRNNHIRSISYYADKGEYHKGRFFVAN